MTKKRSARSFSYSPIHPSLHFVLFLVLAFILVMFVAVVMQQTSTAARARLMCPKSNNTTNSIAELSKRCADGVEYTKDANGCSVWVCKLTSEATIERLGTSNEPITGKTRGNPIETLPPQPIAQ